MSNTSKNNSRATSKGNNLKPARTTAEIQALIATIEQSQSPVELDADGTIVTANETFSSVTGYPLDELEGKRLFSLVTDASIASLRKLWDELRHTDQASHETQIVSKTGKTVYLKSVLMPWLDKNGKLSKVTLLALDTTSGHVAKSEMLKLASAVDGTQTATMMVDRDFVVTYVNDRTKQMLQEYKDEFRKLWPSFDPDKIIGACIDMFHKNPKHQRDLLSDPSRLPYKTRIEVGPLRFALQVSAQRDVAGNYVGNVLEWADITEQCKQELVNSDYLGYFNAIDRSQAVIEFELDGTILSANENFLSTLGYTIDEIRGKHHSMFVDPKYVSSVEYRQFWANLNSGKFEAGEFQRFGKGGREVWIQASYNPVLDEKGKPRKVVKYATDITAAKVRNADYEGQLAAIRKSQAVIEFTMEGTIVNANDNFLQTLGYTLEEIRGKHHSMFAEPTFAASAEYRQFWSDLNSGLFQAGQFKRLGKGGREVWIQASYNPILDVNGRPVKVVKFAADITTQKQMEFDIARKQREDAAAAEDMKHKVTQILDVADRVSHGDYSIEILSAGDEVIGQLGYGLRKFFADKRASEALERERNEKERRVAEDQQRKVQQVLKVVNAVADGNFTIAVPDLGEDAVGQVAKALEAAIVSMRTALVEVRSVASTVNQAAREMTGASQEISKGAQHQASSLEETASSLEEITSTVNQNTENAHEV